MPTVLPASLGIFYTRRIRTRNRSSGQAQALGGNREILSHRTILCSSTKSKTTGTSITVELHDTWSGRENIRIEDHRCGEHLRTTYLVTAQQPVHGARQRGSFRCGRSRTYMTQNKSLRGRSVRKHGGISARALTMACASRKETEHQSERKSEGPAVRACDLIWWRPSRTARTRSDLRSLWRSISHRAVAKMWSPVPYDGDRMPS